MRRLQLLSRDFFENNVMETCCVFRLKNFEFQDQVQYAVQFLEEFKGLLQKNGVECSDPREGKGCPAGFMCKKDAEQVSVIMTDIEEPADESFLPWTSIACWDAPSLWKQIFCPRKKTDGSAMKIVVATLRSFLNDNPNVVECQWMSEKDWANYP